MKALVGSWDHRPYALLAENTALRSKVAELEVALQRAHEENEVLRAALGEAIDRDADIALTTSS